MNAIDIVLGIILIAAAVAGLRKGLVYEVSSLVALVLGIWGALEFSHITEKTILGWLESDIPYIGIIAFIITLALIVWLVHLVGKLAEKLIKAVALGPVNRVLGMVFGLLKAAFILSIILMVLQFFDVNEAVVSKKTRTSSYLYQPVRKFAPRVLNFLNIDFNKTLKDTQNEMEPKSKVV
ncbi:CvpA family protein [Prolixibacteraceae bacterium JC049]|nr:CvpA family protein [Prolixibacteraceae bacterium JC049]